MAALRFLFVVCLIALLATPTTAFGAGSIRSTSRLSNYNARHGDLANILLGISAGPDGKVFTTYQVKCIYFGNWLRDFSQLFDVAGMTKIPKPLLILIVQIFGFMQFGYSTGAFEITPDKIGVYRPEEHIDNPKGYPDRAKETDPRLRGPVRDIELDYGRDENLANDRSVAILNYISNEDVGIDTSTAYIRSQLKRALAGSLQDETALRSLGAALHTLEDFAAHTNYVELCLRGQLPYDVSANGPPQPAGDPTPQLADIFPFVGAGAAKSCLWGSAPPLVPGTFGPLDLFSSILGELKDKASTGTLFELRRRAESPDSDPGVKMSALSNAFSLASSLGLPVPSDLTSAFRKLASTDIKNFTPASWEGGEQISQIWIQIRPFFELRDAVAKFIETTDWKALLGPVVFALLEILGKISEAIDELLYTIIAQVLSPVLDQFVNELNQIGGDLFKAQQELMTGFGDKPEDTNTNPTHSMLSKDHFDNVLNIPAAQVAAYMTKTTVSSVVNVWNAKSTGTGPSPPDPTENLLMMIHHPALMDMKIPQQYDMYTCVRNWWLYKTVEQRQQILPHLSFSAVFNGTQSMEIEDPSTWYNPQLGIPEKAGTDAGIINTIQQIIKNIWDGFQSGLITLGEDVIRQATALMLQLPTTELRNPFDAGMALLAGVHPGIVFNGVPQADILDIPNMGNIAKTGIIGAIGAVVQDLQATGKATIRPDGSIVIPNDVLRMAKAVESGNAGEVISVVFDETFGMVGSFLGSIFH